MKFTIKENQLKYENYEEYSIIKGKATYIEIDFNENRISIQHNNEKHEIINFNKKSIFKIYETKGKENEKNL